MRNKFMNKKMIVTFLLGISSGLPLLAIGSTLQAWMKEQHVDLSIIGIFSLVGLPYTLKFLWAPLLDRYVPPFLGRRRGWMLVAQLGLIATFVLLGMSNPAEQPWMVAFYAFLVAFFSATQDIAIDAYRRELLSDEELGFGSSLAIFGYRMGMLMTGAGALLMAESIPWKTVYFVIASFILLGIVTNIFASNPDEKILPPRTLKDAVIDPFVDYFKRKGAFEILLFILLYKIGDAMASNMTTPFILEMGYAKSDIAFVAKTFGLAATISGGLLGGILLMRLGSLRSLVFFGFLQAITIMMFVLLVGHDVSRPLLTVVIAFENFTSGMGTSAYTAFMASLTNKKFTATQYALLSSLMGVPRVIISAPTGHLAKELGWSGFFIFCTLSAAPGMLLLLRYKKWQQTT